MNIEQRLHDAIDVLDIPDVDTSSAVLARIATDSRVDDTGAATAWWRRRPSIALVAVLAVAGIVVGLTPAGPALARWLGIGATIVRIEPELQIPDGTGSGRRDDPAMSALGPTTATGPSTEPGRFGSAPIAGPGPPTAVMDDPDRGRIYVWETTDGSRLQLSARRIDGATPAIKSVAAEDDVMMVELLIEAGRTPGLWLPGDHRLVVGDRAPERSGPVLLWVRDGIEYRIEGVGDLDRAVGLARRVPVDGLLQP